MILEQTPEEKEAEIQRYQDETTATIRKFESTVPDDLRGKYRAEVIARGKAKLAKAVDGIDMEALCRGIAANLTSRAKK